MFTLIALLTIVFTFTVMVLNLGSVARDTAQALHGLVLNSRSNGRFVHSAAFGLLWLMIFLLSFG